MYISLSGYVFVNRVNNYLASPIIIIGDFCVSLRHSLNNIV